MVIYYLCRTPSVCYTFQKPDSASRNTMSWPSTESLPIASIQTKAVSTQNKRRFLLAKTDEHIYKQWRLKLQRYGQQSNTIYSKYFVYSKDKSCMSNWSHTGYAIFLAYRSPEQEKKNHLLRPCYDFLLLHKAVSHMSTDSEAAALWQRKTKPRTPVQTKVPPEMSFTHIQLQLLPEITNKELTELIEFCTRKQDAGHRGTCY